MRSTALIACTLVAALAGAEPPESRPTTVARCVEAAEKDPAHFSSNLRDELQALTGPELIAGLSQPDPRPEIEKRIRPAVYRALCDEGGHTAATARALLDLARAVDDAALRGCFLRLLARDRAGNKVLQGFLDTSPDSPLENEALLAFLRAAAEANGRQDRPPGRSTVLSGYADRLWARYVRARRQGPTLVEPLWQYVRSQSEYRDRLIALVRADVAAGVAPVADELSFATEQAVEDTALRQELLGWAELPNADIRRVSVQSLMRLLDVLKPAVVSRPAMPPADLVRARRILLNAALDPEQPGRDEIPHHLEELLDDMNLEDARRIADVADMHLSKWGNSEMDALQQLAIQFEELRPRVISHLLGPNLDDAKTIAEGGRLFPRWPEQKWLTKAARDWLRKLTDDDLREEETQERFLIVVVAARLGRSYWSYNLPPSRREPPPLSVPDRGWDWREAAVKAAEDEEAADLKAFGLPLPDKEAVVKPRQEAVSEQPRYQRTPIEPLTPQQRTVRWRRFVMARSAIVRSLGARR